MIAEDYISFEIAKLLKEKGFVAGDGEVGCRCGFYSETAFQRGHGIITKSGQEVGLVFDDLDNPDLEDNEYLRPTLQMAMKWLREKHKIYIMIDRSFSMKDSWHYCICVDNDFDNLIQQEVLSHRKYEQACEAAIKYCLENLI